jgi:hypothetical protein
MARVKYLRALFLSALVLGALVVFPNASFVPASPGRASAQEQLLPEGRLERLVRRHERVRLDPASAAERVRRSGRLTISGPATSFELELAPHDLRAPGYWAQQTVEGGHRVGVESVEVRTYKGRAHGAQGGAARFTVTDEQIEGVVITPGENYYLQPLKDFDAGAAATEFVLYKGSDVREGAIGECAVTLEGQIEQGAEVIGVPTASMAGETTAAATVLKETEIATEADFEYVQALGGAALANAEILSILNQVEGIYATDLGMTIRVVYQHSWSANDDPYVSTEPSAVLTEFRNHWNSSFTNVARDTAHLWTGKELDGTTIGIAFLGVVCRSPRSGYGVSQRLTGTVGKVALTAHEVGHNFNAEHATDCASTIMFPSLGSSTQLTFCQLSRDQIGAFVSANGACLTDVTVTPTPTPTPTPAPTPAPGVLQFNSAAYNVGEAAGALTVTVNRTGNTSAAASVNYTTINGTASGRTDFNGVLGALNFAAGETSKTFTVYITDDAFVEGVETFNVMLRDASGATLGATSTAAVNLADNDTAVTSANPIDGAAFFARQHYVDFLDRAPDSAGLAHWTTQVTNCGNPNPVICRINASAAFFLAIEFQEIGVVVYKTYGAAFGTTRVGSTVPLRFVEFLPDQRRLRQNVIVGTTGWFEQLEANKTAYFNDFVSRPGFLAVYPATMSPAAFVDTLNANAGGALSSAERNQLVTELSAGTRTRAQVLRRVTEDGEFHAAQFRRAFVLMQYFGYLRRDPDAADFRGVTDPQFLGYHFWLGKLNDNNGDYVQAEMVRAFIDSIEYRQRFGQ